VKERCGGFTALAAEDIRGINTWTMAWGNGLTRAFFDRTKSEFW